jgi:hypothetical protein
VEGLVDAGGVMKWVFLEDISVMDRIKCESKGLKNKQSKQKLVHLAERRRV